MKRIIALMCMLIALAFSGSPALFADSGAMAPSDYHAAQEVIMRNVGNCQTCHEAPADQQRQRRQSPDNMTSKIGGGSSNERRWGIKPRPYFSRVNWSPD